MEEANNGPCSQAGIIEVLPESPENWNREFLLEGLLYYGNAQKTDKPYIKFPVLFDGENLINTGKAKILLFGTANKGDFISTYFIYGVGFNCGTEFKELAFAVALEDKESSGIGPINVEFF